MRNRGLMILWGSLSVFGLAACGSGDSPSQAVSSSNVPALTDTGATLALTCTGCHSNANGAIASLNGYTEAALIARLLEYKTDADGTTVMHRLARGYSDEDIALVSAALTISELSP